MGSTGEVQKWERQFRLLRCYIFGRIYLSLPLVFSFEKDGREDALSVESHSRALCQCCRHGTTTLCSCLRHCVNFSSLTLLLVGVNLNRCYPTDTGLFLKKIKNKIHPVCFWIGPSKGPFLPWLSQVLVFLAPQFSLVQCVWCTLKKKDVCLFTKSEKEGMSVRKEVAFNKSH